MEMKALLFFLLLFPAFYALIVLILLPTLPPPTAPPYLAQFPLKFRLAEPTEFKGKFHVLFCTSCSYRKQALQTRDALLSLLPGSVVVLSNYPPHPVKQILSKLVPLFQLGVIALVFMGEHIFSRLGYASPTPYLYGRVRRKRYGTLATCFILGNIFQNTLQSTRAFEIYYNGDLVFSKLQQNRFPDYYELKEIVSRIIELKATL